MKTELQTKEVEEFSVIVYTRKLAGYRHLSAPPWLPEYKCTVIFITMRSYSLIDAMPETCCDTSKWHFLHHVKVLSEKSFI